MIKIAAVSYINTYPFVYGIKKSDSICDYSLSLHYPRNCVDIFVSNKADICLLPVGALPYIKNYNIISDYCISSNKNVNTVLLLSNKPLKNISTIFLDNHSVTSAKLIKLLAKEHWKKEINWIQSDLSSNNNHESVLAIGDKVFELQKNYEYKYDLAEEWYNFTNKPFVFACWIAKPHLDSKIIQEFNKTLSFGIKNKENAIKALYSKPDVNKMIDYVNKNIDYNFSIQKKEALSLFLSLI